MKTKLIIPFLVLMVTSTMSLKAQDTIDTAYYRYDNHWLFGGWIPAVIDTVTGERLFDSVTGAPISACPNGVGFLDMEHHPYNPHMTTYGDNHYMYYKLGATKRKVYGIAIGLDSVCNFMEGDSLTVILCEAATNHTHFIHVDSIIIRGGEIGKQRWCEIPILKSDIDFYHILDDCIDRVEYRSIMEFYFDEPHEILENYLFWKLEATCDYGSKFMISEVHSSNLTAVGTYDPDCTPLCAYALWDHCFPIITPLPEWEESSMEQLIPEREYNPAVHQPDPEDPEDPTDPEAIDGVYGRLPISIYPNPTDGVTTISSPEAIKELTVTDLAGRVLLHQSSMGSTTTLDTAPLEPGLYLLKVTTASGTATTKLAVR